MTTEKPGNRQKKKATQTSFKPGQSGNILGRPKLPEELKVMKEASLSLVIELIYNTISDGEYIASLKPSERLSLIEVVSDRCGLPRVTKSEGDMVSATNELANAIRDAHEKARAAGIIPPLPVQNVPRENLERMS